jgi:hypothetical protein
MTTITVGWGPNGREKRLPYTVIRDQRWHRVKGEWPKGKTKIWLWSVQIKRQSTGVLVLEYATRGKVFFSQRVSFAREATLFGLVTFPVCIGKEQWPLKIRIRQRPIRKTKVSLRILYCRKES